MKYVGNLINSQVPLTKGQRWPILSHLEVLSNIKSCRHWPSVFKVLFWAYWINFSFSLVLPLILSSIQFLGRCSHFINVQGIIRNSSHACIEKYNIAFALFNKREAPNVPPKSFFSATSPRPPQKDWSTAWAKGWTGTLGSPLSSPCSCPSPSPSSLLSTSTFSWSGSQTLPRQGTEKVQHYRVFSSTPPSWIKISSFLFLYTFWDQTIIFIASLFCPQQGKHRRLFSSTFKTQHGFISYLTQNISIIEIRCLFLEATVILTCRTKIWSQIER